MPKYGGITVKKQTSMTIDQTVLERADRLAAKQERSRSWVLEKAIQIGLDQMDPEGKPASDKPSTKKGN